VYLREKTQSVLYGRVYKCDTISALGLFCIHVCIPSYFNFFIPQKKKKEKKKDVNRVFLTICYKNAYTQTKKKDYVYIYEDQFHHCRWMIVKHLFYPLTDKKTKEKE